MPCIVESASLEPTYGNKFVAGGEDMWVRVFDFHTGAEVGEFLYSFHYQNFCTTSFSALISWLGLLFPLEFFLFFPCLHFSIFLLIIFLWCRRVAAESISVLTLNPSLAPFLFS